MPKPLLMEPRYDFSGGRNVRVSPELLKRNELVNMTNWRTDPGGFLIKRTGNQRVHTTVLPASVQGLFQWNSPSGQEVLAVANGNLYHQLTQFSTDFTLVAGSTGKFAINQATHFFTFRANTSGAPLLVFMANGGHYYSWDGTTFTQIDNGVAEPLPIIATQYHTRAFLVSKNFLKNVFWSVVGDATNFTVGLSTQGGSAMVDVLTGNSIIDMEPIGSSLLIFTDQAIVRFTGYSSNDIQIAQDTAGVSAEVGLVGPNADCRVEQVIAFMADRGPYFATEAGVMAIGINVEPDFLAMNRAQIANMVVGHHRGRREVWFAYAGPTDGANNKTVLVYNYRTQSWAGPFTYPFGIASLTPYVDANSLEWILAGCTDGFVRHMDVGVQDDVLANGTGGANYTATAELAPFFFEAGPSLVKALKRSELQANLPPGSAVHLLAAFDNLAFTDFGAITGLSAAQTLAYRVDMNGQGRRLRIQIIDASAQLPIINGLMLFAHNMLRFG